MRFALSFSFFLLTSHFCFFADGASRSEIHRFVESVLNKPFGSSVYENCVRSLAATRFEGEGHRYHRRDRNSKAFTVRSWFSKVVNKNSPRRIWVQVTAYGYLEEAKRAGEGRYFLNNVNAVNFGFVPEDFDFQGALQETERAKDDPAAWQEHVKAMKGELEKALKSLRLGAEVAIVTNSLGISPLERLAIGFASEDHKDRWRSIFTNFRGVPVQSLLKGKRPEKTTAPVVYDHDPEEGPWVEEGPQANLGKLTGSLRTFIARLLENPRGRPGWSTRFNIFVKVANDEAAEALGLTRKGFSKNSYQTNWSLETIADASLDPSVVLISPRNQ